MPDGDRIGAEDPWEKAMECVSGPALDRRLPCCESGRNDRRLIQEPLDDTESRESSAVGATVPSAWRTNDCLRLLTLGGVSWVLLVGR